MRKMFFSLSLVLAAANADIVECENGDRYNGKVLLVDEQNVKLQNEITGILSIPRSKVSTISFGNARIRPSATLPNSPTNLHSQSQPIQFNAAAVEQVQNQLLGDANPEATQMFQDMVRGLMTGKLDLGEIRTKAQASLDELKQLQKELGDDDTAALLGSYASILENFLRQAPATATNPPAPAKAKEK